MLLESDELAEVPILLLANKQDLPNAVSPSDVAVEMGLNGVDGRVRVRGTCAVTGEGLQEAMMELHGWIREVGSYSALLNVTIYYATQTPCTVLRDTMRCCMSV